MKVTRLAIPDVLLLEPVTYPDARGYFFESFNHRVFEEVTGRRAVFVQDNQSHSVAHVLRGLHYQVRKPQAKLVRVLSGAIFDVAVDLRRASLTFGHWVATRLSAENRHQVWIPEGFAHGFLVLSETADVFYKTTDYRAPECERTILWSDPSLDIEWPDTAAMVISAKDAAGLPLALADVYD